MKKFLIFLIPTILIFIIWNHLNKPTTEPIKETKTELLAPSSANISTKSTSLEAENSFSGSGTATTSWNNQTFTHKVEATLPTPPPDKFYEGWLVQTQPLNFFSTGELTLANDKYALEYSERINYPNHIQVIITQETLENGLDNIPEVHILEGNLK
jgi:hypothetical protein